MGQDNRSQNNPPSYNESQGRSSQTPFNTQPQMNAPNYGTTSNQPQQYSSVVYVNTGPCSRGGNHAFTTEFTLGGVLCALFFFPIGILCCLCLTERRCLKCGGRFD